MLKEEVDEEDIAEIVSKWTGIPVSKMLEGEMQKLLHMEDRLRHAGRGTGRGGDGRVRCGSAGAGRDPGPEQADRQLHFPRAHGRGKDGTRAGAGGVPVRRRAGHDPDRHVRIPGTAYRLPPDRRASRVCGVRGRRPADRGRAAGNPIRSSCSTRSRRPIPRCSTCCFSFWTTAG